MESCDGSQPKVTHIDPVIFALARKDLTKPPHEVSRDRVQRIKRRLKTIDEQQGEVRANFHHIVKQEKRRIEQGSALHRHRHGEGEIAGPGIGLDEARSMLAAMSAPVDPETDYNVDATAQALKMWEQFGGADESFDRANSLRQLGLVAEQGVHHIDEFLGVHMAQLRGKWEAILEKEKRAVEGFVRADDAMQDALD